MSLFSAVEAGNVSEVKRLLEAGASPNYQNYYGHSALMLAINKRSPELIQLLLPVTDPNIQNVFGNSALILAANNDYDNVVRSLLQSGAKVNISNKDGNTALMCTTDSKIIEMLILAGAEINLKNNKQETALYLAVNYDDLKAANVLLTYGARPNSEILQAAIENENMSLIRVLQEYNRNRD